MSDSRVRQRRLDHALWAINDDGTWAYPSIQFETIQVFGDVPSPRANLARHKSLREVVFIPALPRNDTGKVLRTRLAARNGHPECDQ